MSLPVLVVIVVLGIAAVVLAVHFTGGTRDALLADADAARQRFAEEYPNEKPRHVVLTASGSTAFLELDASRTGVVQSIGDRFLTRIVTPASVAGIREDGVRLGVDFRDFTWRRVTFVFASRADAMRIASRLTAANQNENRRTA